MWDMKSILDPKSSTCKSRSLACRLKMTGWNSRSIKIVDSKIDYTCMQPRQPYWYLKSICNVSGMSAGYILWAQIKGLVIVQFFQ